VNLLIKNIVLKRLSFSIILSEGSKYKYSGFTNQGRGVLVAGYNWGVIIPKSQEL
jgi:hypothetical protein